MPFALTYYANGSSGGSASPPNAATLAQHAIEAVNADLSTGSLAIYDNNGDGLMVSTSKRFTCHSVKTCRNTLKHNLHENTIINTQTTSITGSSVP
jgi:hypothetical protein